MTRKFDVTFSAPTKLSPSYVYVSPSDAYPGKFAVGVLHPISSAGSFQSSAGITRTFDLRQNLVNSEADAITWASQWLHQQSGCSASLNEVTEKS